MKVLIPSNLDLEELFLAQKLEIPEWFKLDYGKYFLSLITLVPLNNKRIRESMDNGWVPLSSTLMQKVHRQYDKYWHLFKKLGIIEINKHYSPQENRCMSYRFSKYYEEYLIVTSDYSSAFQKKISKLESKRQRDVAPEYKHLTKWLGASCKLEIDADQAYRFLERRFKVQLLNPEIRDTKKNKKGYKVKKHPHEQYMHGKISVDALKSEGVRFEIDQIAGRLHTTLTNMKSDLRNLITYEGKKLASIDIANSQPYFATVLLEKYSYKKSRRKTNPKREYTKSNRNRRIEEINREIANKISKDTLMLVFGGEVSDSQVFSLYKLLVGDHESEKRDLYDYMLDKSHEQQSENLSDFFNNRKEVKVGMFEVFFSKNSYNTKTKRLFANNFPEIDKLFRFLKKDDYTLLACLLQSIESFYMLKVITKRLSVSYPNMPIFTIHDSVIVPEEYKDVVASFISNQLELLIGVKPILKVDLWTPDNINWDEYPELTKEEEAKIDGSFIHSF